ncbi:MAG: HupE/UreJ family protein [Polyangiaceae bacterium]
MIRRAILVCCVLVIASLVFARTSFAHGLETAYLEMVEAREGDATVVLKTPGPRRDLTPRFDSRCRSVELDHDGQSARSQSLSRWRLLCARGVAGTVVSFDGFGLGVTSVVMRVLLADGSSRSQVLTAKQPSFEIAGRPSWVEMFARYLRLGVEHILSGADHLLFVLGLWVAARSRKELVTTISAFTLAHSVTLVANVMGWIEVSSLFAEACIASSLVLLALDLPRVDRPALLAFAFGLVHGLGFAGALSEIGLPSSAVPLSLLAFNVGVELGQMAFVFSLVLATRVASRVAAKSGRSLSMDTFSTPCAYAIGSAGTFLLIQRVALIVANR